MIDMKFKVQFFDPKKVLRQADRAKVKVTSKAGSFVRQTQKRSIKKRRRGTASAPGNPPFTHGGQLFKRHIYFSRPAGGYDSVVIGPAKISVQHPEGDGKPSSGGTVPEVLEYGGQTTRQEYFSETRRKWVRVTRRSRKRVRGKAKRLRTVRVAARPSARPALAREAPKFPELFRGTIGGG